jgi:signal transduction histidine kinase
MRRAWMNWPNLGFSLALAVLVGSAVLSYHNGLSVAAAAENRARAFETLDQLQAFLAVFMDIETGARGYVITGDRKFLEPYNAGLERLNPQLERLHASLADDPRQRPALTALEEASIQLARRAQIVVSLKAERNDGAAERAVGTGEGKRVMDRIRSLIAQLIAEDREQLELREEQFQAELRSRVHFILAGSLVGFVAVGLAAVSVNLNLRRRIRLNAKLQQSLADNTQGLERLRATGIDLNRSNQELEQFAYIASHDLQEPLRKVSSFAQLLAKQYQGKLDADADEFIGFMVDGARRMQALIQNLLAFSRLGRKGKAFTPVDAAAPLKQALANLQSAIEECGAGISSGQLPTVLGDEVQLVQLFQNLIGNAIKFRGTEKPVIQVRAESAGPEWTFSVSDNGIGIDPQFAERIFVIFQRLHSREEYPGTGIGLAFCKKIVERHGGRIWLASHPAPGTTFCFTLPAPVEPEQATHERTHARGHDRNPVGGRRPGRRPADGGGPQADENAHQPQLRP